MVVQEIVFGGCSSTPSDSCCPAGDLALACGFAHNGNELVSYDFDFDSDIDSDSAEEVLGNSPWLPVLQFGLQQCGNLSIADSFVVNSASINDNSGSGAARVHASTQTEAADWHTVSAQVMQAIKVAFTSQAEARGCYTAPFLVRYAPRLANGHHLPASPPILLLPGTVPPCFEASVVDNGNGKSTLTLGCSSVPYHDLRVRCLSDMPPDWAEHITAIDIYASPQISTYVQDDSIGYITDYATILGQRCQTCTNRGRNNDNEDTNKIFIGNWSTGSDKYLDHTISLSDAARIRAWHLLPNTSLADDIAKTDTFYLIASIPAAQIKNCADFMSLPVGSTCNAQLQKLPMLTEHPHYGTLAPQHKLTLGAYTHYAGGELFLAKPFAISPGELAPSLVSILNPQPIKICAIGKSQRAWRKSVALMPADTFAIDLSTAFTRYIYHPDPEARYLIISQGESNWLINLTKHSNLPGVYWSDPLSCDPAPHTQSLAEILKEIGVANQDLSDTEALALLQAMPEKKPCGNRMFLSATSNPTVIIDSLTTSDSPIKGLAPAARAMSQGQFGQYSLYALCADSIWAVSATKGAYSGCNLVDTAGCISSASVCQTPAGIAYASRHDIHILNGSQCKVLGAPKPSQLHRYWSMPYMQQILTQSMSDVTMPTIDEFSGSCTVSYDASRDIIHVKDPNRDLTYAYHIASQLWTMGMPMPMRRLVITRPIATAKIKSNLWGIDLMGILPHDCAKIAIYGSNDLLYWQLLASANAWRIVDIHEQPPRWTILVASFDKNDEICLSGCAFFRQK